ncbi:MAG TPA: hypothetical protein VH107_03450 [Lacipirellulaceae bacterium]|nr:hypothetical protein [Lacipirellulaceae bacterium]
MMARTLFVAILGCVLADTISLAADNQNATFRVVIEPSGDSQSAPHGKGNIYAPCVLYENGLYRMWFGGQGKDGHDRIHLAESHDCLHWKPRGVVLEDPTANHVNDPSVVKHGSTYFMYYTRAATDIRDDIALATSNDGVHWAIQGVVLSPSSAGNWDSLLVGRPSVLVEGDRFRMWYDGRKDLPVGAPAPTSFQAATSSRSVGYAESHDGYHWARPQSTPEFGENAGGVDVVRVGSRYVMLYESASGTQFATSKDGLIWKADGILAPLSGGDADRFGHVTPFLLLDHPAGSATLFIGAARNSRWDENLIVRTELSQSQFAKLHGP